MRKVNYLLLLLLFHLIIGCGTPAEYRKAQESLAEGDFIEALKYYEMTLEKVSIQSDREIIQENIDDTKRKIVDKTIERADKSYRESIPPTVESIDKALFVLDKSSLYDDKFQRISKKTTELKNEKDTLLSMVSNLINDAYEMAEKEDYYNAIEKLRKAQKIDTTNKQLSNKITEMENLVESNKIAYTDKINKYLSAGNGKEAGVVYDKLVLSDPHYPGLNDLKKEIQKSYQEQVLSDVKSLEAQNKWFKAYQKIKKSALNTLDGELNKIKTEGRQYYVDKAETFFESGDMYLAYIASFKAKEFDPDNINIFRIMTKCEDYLEKEIQKYIAIPTFDSPANDPDAGKYFSDALISRLFRILPFGINIVEREKIDLLISEQKMELKNISNLLGVNMIITGNVSLFNVDHSNSERMVTTKMKMGEEEKPNPEYTQFLNTYGKDINNWPYKPPVTVKEDKYEIIKYKKGQAVVKAFANLSIRIFDSDKAAIVYAKDFQDSIGKSDDFQEAIEGSNVEEDPLELPVDTEIKRELQNKILDNVVQTISEVFEKREKRFLQWTTFHIERKEYPEAIKYISQAHLYSRKAKIDNEYTQKIYNYMIELTEGDVNL
ncbi:MAG: hypothetical protein AB1499_08885 [Nitrospirota bacterium]